MKPELETPCWSRLRPAGRQSGSGSSFTSGLLRSAALHGAALVVAAAAWNGSSAHDAAPPRQLEVTFAVLDETLAFESAPAERVELTPAEVPDAALLEIREPWVEDPTQPFEPQARLAPDGWVALDALRSRALAPARREPAEEEVAPAPEFVLVAPHTPVMDPVDDDAPEASPVAPASPLSNGPRLVHAPPPTYPPISLRLGEQGSVTVAIDVGPSGAVVDVRVLRSSGSRRLDEAAREGVRAWRFEPATRGGAPVTGTYEHRVTFLRDAR